MRGVAHSPFAALDDHPIELIERHAARAPDSLAVCGDDGALTYRQLCVASRRLAQRLRALGVGPEARVGVCLERSTAWVVALLGVLRAGGAYVPLDLSHPRDRRSSMAADAAVVAAVADQAGADLALPDGVPLVRIDLDVCIDRNGLDGHAGVPDRPGTLRNAAYVMYTSGTTGLPKGVICEHAGLCNLVAAQRDVFGMRPQDRVIQLASLSFDASVFEVAMALGAGAFRGSRCKAASALRPAFPPPHRAGRLAGRARCGRPPGLPRRRPRQLRPRGCS